MGVKHNDVAKRHEGSHAVAQHSSAEAGQLTHVEEKESRIGASGSAGLNLNVFAALGGALSSMTRKTKHENEDGSSYSEEENHTAANAHGAGNASLAAVAQAQAEANNRMYRGIEQGNSKALAQADHLGIEGPR